MAPSSTPGPRGAVRGPRAGLTLNPRLSRNQRQAPSEQGSAVIEFVFLGVLLLVPLVYLILMLAQLQAGAYAVSSAAREAGRAFVTADSEAQGRERAQVAAALAFTNLGVEGAREVRLSCLSDPCFQPGAQVRASAEAQVPLPLIPAFARSVIPLSVPVRAEAVVRIDRFRGLP